MKNRLVIISILLIAFLTACNISLAEDITPPPGFVAPTMGPTLGVLYPSSPPSPAKGKMIYTQHCVQCHGDHGLGNGPQSGGVPVPVSAIGLRDISSQYNPAKWYTVISQGQMDRYMPPFDSLSENERWDVLSYVYTLSNPASQAEQGAAIYAAQCAECHGVDGKASTGSLSGSVVDFSDQVFMSKVTGLGLYRAIEDGILPGMQSFSDSLTDAEIWSLTAYLRTLTYDLTTPLVVEASPTDTPVNTLEPSQTPGQTQTMETGGISTQSIEPVTEPTETVIPTLVATPVNTEVPMSTSPFGKVTGVLTNGSGGTLPENSVVNLLGFAAMNEVFDYSAEVNPDGSFEFTEVLLEPDVALVVTSEMEGITYNSDFVVYDGTTTEFDLPLTMYDTTTDVSFISADRVHLFFEFISSDIIQIIEIYIISNSSNMAVIPAGEGQSVQDYILPEGAANLTFESGSIGNPFIQKDNGFGDPSTVLPGPSTYQLMYAFQLPYDKKITIDQPINMNIGSIIVMTPDGLEIDSDQLVFGGSRDMQGKTYSIYNGQDFTKGDLLSFEVQRKTKECSFIFFIGWFPNKSDHWPGRFWSGTYSRCLVLLFQKPIRPGV